jgi:hypothetical protein
MLRLDQCGLDHIVGAVAERALLRLCLENCGLNDDDLGPLYQVRPSINSSSQFPPQSHIKHRILI